MPEFMASEKFLYVYIYIWTLMGKKNHLSQHHWIGGCMLSHSVLSFSAPTDKEHVTLLLQRVHKETNSKQVCNHVSNEIQPCKQYMIGNSIFLIKVVDVVSKLEKFMQKINWKNIQSPKQKHSIFPSYSISIGRIRG